MSDLLKEEAAKILVESGYAYRYTVSGLDNVHRIIKGSFEGKQLLVNPFTDTLEGRKQADVIENHLIWNGFHREFICTSSLTRDFHQWRLDTIKDILERRIK